MSEVDLDDIKRRMEGSLNSLKTEFMGLRAGRASTGMLEPVMVDAYLNPMAEGTLIRVPIPDLSEERRRDMVKVASRYAEAARVSVRNVRRDGIETARKMQKDSLLSEDELRDMEGDIQKLTDDHVKMIDDALANKEKEITQL